MEHRRAMAQVLTFGNAACHQRILDTALAADSTDVAPVRREPLQHLPRRGGHVRGTRHVLFVRHVLLPLVRVGVPEGLATFLGLEGWGGASVERVPCPKQGAT